MPAAPWMYLFLCFLCPGSGLIAAFQLRFRGEDELAKKSMDAAILGCFWYFTALATFLSIASGWLVMLLSGSLFAAAQIYAWKRDEVNGIQALFLSLLSFVFSIILADVFMRVLASLLYALSRRY